MSELYSLPKRTVDYLTCTAQVVAHHLEQGNTSVEDIKHLRSAVTEVESEIRNKQLGFQPTESQQRVLWGD